MSHPSMEKRQSLNTQASSPVLSSSNVNNGQPIKNKPIFEKRLSIGDRIKVTEKTTTFSKQLILKLISSQEFGLADYSNLSSSRENFQSEEVFNCLSPTAFLIFRLFLPKETG